MGARRINGLKSNNIGHYHAKNLVITMIFLVCLSIIYRYSFLTKSAIITSQRISFNEYVEYEQGENYPMRNLEDIPIEINEDENGDQYIVLPEKIEGYHVARYRLVEKDSDKSDDNTPSNKKSNETNTIQNVNNNINNNTNNDNKNFAYLQTKGQKNKILSSEEIEDNSNFSENDANNSDSEGSVSSEEANNEALSDGNEDIDESSNENESSSEEVNTEDNSVEESSSAFEETQESSDNTNNESNSDKEILRYFETPRETSFIPGEKYYFDDVDSLSFDVMYKTVIINDTKLYKQDLTFDEDGVTITATGYIPYGYNLNVIPQDEEEMRKLMEGVTVEDDAISLSDTQLLAAYDISIIENKEDDSEEEPKEYQPQEFNQTIEISIASKEELGGQVNNDDIIPVHVRKDVVEQVNDEGQKYEEEVYSFDQINVSGTGEDSVEFYTDSFSPFLLLRVNPITENAILIDDRVSDLNYYTGKNYTDGVVGTNQNLYPDNKKIEITVNYFGFDSSNGPYKEVLSLDDQGNPVYEDVNQNGRFDSAVDNYVYDQEPLSGYISNTETQNIVTYKIVRYKNAANKVSFELIDNPFMDRPVWRDERGKTSYQYYDHNFPNRDVWNMYGFDGWISHESSRDVINVSSSNSCTQQCTITAGSATAITVNLYAKWSVANYMFYNQNAQTNGYGYDPLQPSNQQADVMNHLMENNYYKTTSTPGVSNRELNILVIQRGAYGSSRFASQNKGFTVTSLFNGTDYRTTDNATINAADLEMKADFQMDFVQVNSSGNYSSGFNSKGTGLSYHICAHGYNLRIGRGVVLYNDGAYNAGASGNRGNTNTTFAQITGRGSNNNINQNYKLVVESGKYHSIITGVLPGNNNNTYDYTALATTIIGNDIDRVTGNNDNLKVYAGYASRTARGTITADSSGYCYDTVVKSGTIGMDLFQDALVDNPTAGDFPYAGMYLGGHYYATKDAGHRKLTIEGGNIANLIGGLCIDSNDKTRYKTYIYVKGGTVLNIVGGAGRSTTYGDRCIQVTGGTVTYSVSGASNGYQADSSSNPGDLDGKTLVYIGGNSVIGNTTGTLYGVTAGSVLGAGNGNAGTLNTSGLAKNTHVIIDGEAQINGNVYAGGNFGQVKPDGFVEPTSTKTVTTTNVSTSFAAGVPFIISSSGTTNGRHYYNSGGTLNKTTTNFNNEINIAGQWIFVQSGNGYYIQNAADPSQYLSMYYRSRAYGLELTTNLNNRTLFTVTQTGDHVTIMARVNNNNRYISVTSGTNVSGNSTNLYLLSQTVDFTYNNVNENATPNVVATIDVLGGTIGNGTPNTGCVYGGSNSNDISGSTVINVKGGNIKNTLYGGSNTSGVVKQFSTINITGGTIGGGTNSGGNVITEDAIFAGGKGEFTAIVNKTTINIQDQDDDIVITGNIYGGSEQGTVISKSIVTVDEDISSSQPGITISGKIFGGGKGTNDITAKNKGDTTVQVNGLDNTSTVTVFGGANVKGSTTGDILVKIGENKTTHVDEVYGGGYTADVLATTTSDNVYVYSHATVRNVYGGGNQAGIIGGENALQRAVYIDGATITNNVYGGSNSSGNLEDSYVYVTNGATANEVYGGGFGQNTNVVNANVYVDGSQANNIYGGGDAGTISGKTIVVVEDSTNITGVYGGGKGSTATTTGNTDVTITDSDINDVVFGGGNNGPVVGSTKVVVEDSSNVNKLYGGGSTATVSGSTTVEVTESHINSVFGGGEGQAAVVGVNTSITIDDSTITYNVFGGGDNAAVTGNTSIDMKNGSSASNVYGGGNVGAIGGDTTITIEDSSVSHNIYGGGERGAVTGDVNIDVKGTTVSQNIYGGGNQGNVSGNIELNISSSSTVSDNVYGGGNQGNVSGNVELNISSSSTVGVNVYGGGNNGDVTGTVDMTIDSSTITGNVYGGGNLKSVDGDITILIDSTAIGNTLYGGGNNGNAGSDISITMDSTTVGNNVYGGGDNGTVAGDIELEINGSSITSNVYGGGNAGNVTGTTKVTMDNSTATNLYGGGQAATVAGTDVEITGNSTVDYAYGGGKGTTATTTGNTKIIVNGSTVNNDIYGGGDAGSVSGKSIVGLTNATIGESAYAAGNGETATVGKSSYIYAEGSTTIGDNLFGGGNAATTGDNSTDAWAIVDIAGATVGGNVYGGANSSVIKGHAVVNIGIDAISEFYTDPTVEGRDIADNVITYTITNPDKKNNYTQGDIDIDGTVFGGGEQMVEGKDEYDFNSISVEGVIEININANNYKPTYDINIGESIFGSGNASSANRNGDIFIKNWGTDLDIKRLISIQRASTLELTNSNIASYGIADSTNAFGNVDFSLNIIELLKLKDNSRIYMYNGVNKVSGYASVYTDSVSGDEEYNTVTIKNNVYDENDTLIYIIDGNKFCDPEENVIAYISDNNVYYANAACTNPADSDVVDEITDLIKQSSKIVTQSVTSDADNRIYMYSGKNLNLSSKEDEQMYDDPGDVKGMTFFGLFKEGATASGIYSGIYDQNYQLGNAINYSERDFISAYVMGIHYPSPNEHNILQDGFYTNYENVPPDYEDYLEMERDTEGYHSTSYCSVITPTPQSATYYRWYAKPGEKIFRIPLKITASKFSTFGTATSQLVFDDVYPNAELTITNVEATTINRYGLYDKNTIPNVANTNEEALTRFGLVMRTGNAGWKLNGETEFRFDPDTLDTDAIGTQKYEIENSNIIPSLSFYIFNSNNITEKRTLGTYTITMRMEYPIDALNKGTAIVIIEIGLDTDNYDNRMGYNAAITPGEQYDLFSSSTTNISHKSSFSTYFELAQENFKDTEFSNGLFVRDYYNDFYRVVATRNYVFPEDTTITMIDKSIAGNPKYYYYNVTAQDVANNKTVFPLSDFYVMGNKDAKYDEAAGQAIYYNDTIDYEYENFIFIFNFDSSKFQGLNPNVDTEAIVVKQPITIELRSVVLGVDRAIFTVLDRQAENDMYFSIYKTETAIAISGTLNKTRIYLGNQLRLTATTEYNMSTEGAALIYDTRYFDKKLGIVISMYEKGVNGAPDRQLVGSDVLGLSFTLNGSTYYPRADGTTRIKIAEKVSNVASPITVDTANMSLSTGDYYFILQSFGSADGIYFGTDVSAVSTPINFKLINDEFGLNVSVPDRESIVEGDNGHILDTEGRLGDENEVEASVGYISGLSNPYIGVSLYRRKYDTEYQNEYEKVDLQDYVQETLTPVTISYSDSSLNQYEYEAFGVNQITTTVTDITQITTFTQGFTYADGPLRTGTYKLVYTLYDRYDSQIVVEQEGGTYAYQDVYEYEKIGDDFAYIIIK